MNSQKMRFAVLLLAAGVSGVAQAALQGRDLNGSVGSFEAYYDTVLDITWLANANVNGAMTWAAANTWAANLSFSDGVNVYDNWRLPTIDPVNGVSFNYSSATDGSSDIGFNITSPNSEMAYMFYVNLGNLGYFTPAGAVSGCYVNTIDTCLDNVGPFSNFPSNIAVAAYWSATAEFALNTNLARTFRIDDGGQSADYKTTSYYAWAVSSGDVGVAAVPEPEAWGLMLSGLVLVGAAARRRVTVR